MLLLRHIVGLVLWVTGSPRGAIAPFSSKVRILAAQDYVFVLPYCQRLPTVIHLRTLGNSQSASSELREARQHPKFGSPTQDALSNCCVIRAPDVLLKYRIKYILKHAWIDACRDARYWCQGRNLCCT